MNSKVKFTVARISITLLFLIVTMLQILSFPGQITHMRDKNSWGLVLKFLYCSLWFHGCSPHKLR